MLNFECQLLLNPGKIIIHNWHQLFGGQDAKIDFPSDLTSSARILGSDLHQCIKGG